MSSLQRWPEGPSYARPPRESRDEGARRRLRNGLALAVLTGLVVAGTAAALVVPPAVAGRVTGTQPWWDCEVGGRGGPSEEPDGFDDPARLPTAARLAPGTGCTFVTQLTNTSRVPVTLRAVEDAVGGPGRSGSTPVVYWAAVGDGPKVTPVAGRLGVEPDPHVAPADVLEAHAVLDTPLRPGETVVLRIHRTGAPTPLDDCLRLGYPIDVVVAMGPVSGRAELRTVEGEVVRLSVGPATETGCA
ncbi:hypothetical protein [Aquipuribacter sp. SD81]|uniref:hypothetical protein n=1 Tax=Aquipuribacter sp. SD81 TaxID=3127703 RepID=UPI003016CA27